jgi:hypothetical protein
VLPCGFFDQDPAEPFDQTIDVNVQSLGQVIAERVGKRLGQATAKRLGSQFQSSVPALGDPCRHAVVCKPVADDLYEPISLMIALRVNRFRHRSDQRDPTRLPELSLAPGQQVNQPLSAREDARSK